MDDPDIDMGYLSYLLPWLGQIRQRKERARWSWIRRSFYHLDLYGTVEYSYCTATNCPSLYLFDVLFMIIVVVLWVVCSYYHYGCVCLSSFRSAWFQGTRCSSICGHCSSVHNMIDGDTTRVLCTHCHTLTCSVCYLFLSFSAAVLRYSASWTRLYEINIRRKEGQ